MLIGFKLQNFRSFLGEQVFSFAASSDRAHEPTHCMPTGMKSPLRVTKSAAIFGPNASGKSNLLAAMATFRDMILHSTSYTDVKLSERHTPFQFGPAATQPTDFEIDALIGGVRYRYSMSYDSQRIRSERLLVYRSGKAQRWFERHVDPTTGREEWAPFSPHFNGPREMWRRATRPKALFLTAAAQLNSEQLAPLVHWIEHCIEVLRPSDLNDGGRCAALVQNEPVKARVLRLLRAVGIPVEDVRVVDQESHADHGVPRAPAQRHNIEFLYAREGAAPIWMDAAFEAAGTRRLFTLFGPLLTAIDKGKLLLIDEFDTGLHPLIARFLIQLVNDTRVSNRGAQLLLTSHNTTLMDLDILRRDCIWLMTLDAQHASGMRPLSDSNPRKRELIAKNYLSGRYGAVPLIQPELSTAQPESPDAGEFREQATELAS